MKKFMILMFSLVLYTGSFSQCAMCTKTAQQMGEKPAKGLNSGILYLMIAPFAIIGFIGFRWWKSNRAQEEIRN